MQAICCLTEKAWSLYLTGIAQKTAVMAMPITKTLPLSLLTFSKMALATDSSSISCSPVPSTSQMPAWAMFHKPVLPESTNPKDRESGK